MAAAQVWRRWNETLGGGVPATELGPGPARAREILEDHLCTGWEEILPEELGALTSAMLICDDVERGDNGRIARVGCVYWNPCYAVMDEIAELRERSFVLFDSA